MDRGLVHAVTEHVVDRAMRAIDGELGEIGAAKAGQLGVEVGEEACLHEGIIRSLDARHQVPGVERHLLGLREEVRWIAIKGHLADQLHGGEFLGDQLRGIEQVDAFEPVAPIIGQHLDAQLVFKEGTGFDAVGEIAAMEVGIHTCGDLRLFPHEGMDAGDWLPVEFDQRRRASGVNETKGVNPEPLHGPERPGDTSVAHVPQHMVGRLRMERDEVPKGVVGGLGLGDLDIGMGFGGVDDVGKLDAVLNEEDRNIVTDQVECPLGCVELHREATGVSDGVGRAAGAEDGGEAGEDGGDGVLGEEARLGHGARHAVGLEDAVGG